MRSYIFYGWADNLIDPDGGSNGVTQDQSLSTAGEPGDVVWPADGWCDIRQAWKSPQEVPCFTNGHIVQYFVTRTVHDGLPPSDFKSINQSALYITVGVFKTSRYALVEGYGFAAYAYQK